MFWWCCGEKVHRWPAGTRRPHGRAGAPPASSLLGLRRRDGWDSAHWSEGYSCKCNDQNNDAGRLVWNWRQGKSPGFQFATGQKLNCCKHLFCGDKQRNRLYIFFAWYAWLCPRTPLRAVNLIAHLIKFRLWNQGWSERHGKHRPRGTMARPGRGPMPSGAKMAG